MDDFHRRLARIGLDAAAEHGFALAGGYAVQAHGILQRPSEDVDLFTSAMREDFAEGAAKIIAAYRDHGLDVRIDVDSPQFMRLWVTDTGTGRESKVELAADLRSNPPVAMAIGPVAHLDDVAGGKVEALFSRAEARDFIDVDALLTSGAFTRDELLALAAARDAGFDHSVFAQMLTSLDIYPDTELTAYGLTTAQVTGLRRRITD
ncbi:nucleotidyl transferase AbiEii/AbiGii toxin family protein [Actinoallomurus purpureus]|uniref:nucleotidyl transferase AbiEii/AbiGii toxin family protein n=1 Tax=Actinoallomurus purpureus TaxID=478114 RepID=UPI002092FFB0|nr:nucleotidyl transferase AbiEii/AbiGii toxin family protein [Actinoallomurus purpureus]MCO6009143.1 nucleotidyl transferase AbiEii/AbiGii toxin family protein [Actinoallomurus purpureus]